MKRWKPKIGDKIWYIHQWSCWTKPNFGRCYIEDLSLLNKTYYSLGYFRTKKEAQAQIKKIYALFWGK